MTHMDLVRVPQPLKPWWLDVAEVHLLLRWLVDNFRIRTLDEAVYMVEKPKRWAAHREDMLREEEMERLAEEQESREDRYAL